MRDSSEGSAYPNDVSSTAVLGASEEAPQTLEQTDSDSLGTLICSRIADAATENETRGQRGRSWALDGRHPALVWQTRGRWLAGAAAELGCSRGRQLCRDRHLSPRTALLVARACARFADAGTGRGVTASNRTIGHVAAELAGRARPFSHDVVSNARAVLAELGLAVEVVQGRYLTAQERFLAAVHHDGVQRRAASTWALTSPRRWYTKSYLPRRGPTGSKTPRRCNSPNGARKRARAPFGRSPREPGEARPLAAQIVTGQLVATVPSLDTGGHLGSLVDVVAELVDCQRWTARDLVAILDQDARENPRDWPSRITNPPAFLRHRLSQLRDVLAGPSPSEVAAEHRRQAVAQQRRRDDELARAAERKATPNQVARHMDTIRQALNRPRRADRTPNERTTS